MGERSEQGTEPVEERRRLVGVSEWQMITKGPDGEAEVHDLVARRYSVEPGATEADIQRLRVVPAEIHPTEITTVDDDGEIERVIVLPDIQATFRRNESGELEPVHSEEALDVALQVIRDTQPHQVILNGDVLDFTTLSKHPKERAFHETITPSLNAAHEILARIRANAPNTVIKYIAGNHEKRLEAYLAKNAPELAELRQAGSDQRMLTVPYLLNLDAIGGVEYIAGYPGGQHWLTDDLKVTHGNVVRQGAGSTVAAVLKKAANSEIFGHVHRIEIAFKTAETRYAGRLVVAASFGCLSNIEGRVPSYGSSIDDEGRPVRRPEDWQNGFGYLEIERETGRLALLVPVFIDTFNENRPYATRFINGKTYVPSRKQVEAEVVA